MLVVLNGELEDENWLEDASEDKFALDSPLRSFEFEWKLDTRSDLRLFVWIKKFALLILVNENFLTFQLMEEMNKNKFYYKNLFFTVDNTFVTTRALFFNLTKK